ncbi:hypothetical protein [Engelhardtia mirabilis]|uniref:Uncharacterized protein n=1 Tax=Engelhardtia mirabilis TaxID=2528011 RepID=A0A518BLT2_9BACT|nr:hypothetical protein Pla133_30200 [Planctomycetes bacterium Pla133]QDV02257.1 hypothetical protein Pla86_30190 [Planctomycetes bacterium Pla86]
MSFRSSSSFIRSWGTMRSEILALWIPGLLGTLVLLFCGMAVVAVVGGDASIVLSIGWAGNLGWIGLAAVGYPVGHLLAGLGLETIEVRSLRRNARRFSDASMPCRSVKKWSNPDCSFPYRYLAEHLRATGREDLAGDVPWSGEQADMVLRQRWLGDQRRRALRARPELFDRIELADARVQFLGSLWWVLWGSQLALALLAFSALMQALVASFLILLGLQLLPWAVRVLIERVVLPMRLEALIELLELHDLRDQGGDDGAFGGSGATEVVVVGPRPRARVAACKYPRRSKAW